MKSNELNTYANAIQNQIYQLIKNGEQCDKICLSQYKVTTSQSCTLLSLPQKGSLSMNELSEVMGIVCSSMTRIVDSLVKKKLVQRRIDDKDRRIVRVSLTKQGQELGVTLEKEFQIFFKSVLENIRDQELHVILDSMEKVNRAFLESFKNYCATL